jgi:RNA polymerase sigma-70 factor, ECF subfamily
MTGARRGEDGWAAPADRRVTGTVDRAAMTSPTIDAARKPGRWLAPDASAMLMRAAQGGTSRDLEVLLQTLRPTLLEYFTRRVDPAAAEDLAQRALLIVARRYRCVSPDGAARWLVTVARNVVRDEFRRTSRAAIRRAPEHDARAIPASGAPGAHAEYSELSAAIVRAAYDACSAPLRAVIFGVMRGLEVAEVARELGVSEPAVRVRLTRARYVLRRELHRFWQ